MRLVKEMLTFLAVLVGMSSYWTTSTQAGGYHYRARSLYVTPPIYANLPVFGQPPIVVYEPVVTYPAPVAGYYSAVPARTIVPTAGVVVPVGRAYPRQVYQARRNGVVRFAERW